MSKLKMINTKTYSYAKKVDETKWIVPREFEDFQYTGLKSEENEKPYIEAVQNTIFWSAVSGKKKSLLIHIYNTTLKKEDNFYRWINKKGVFAKWDIHEAPKTLSICILTTVLLKTFDKHVVAFALK